MRNHDFYIANLISVYIAGTIDDDALKELNNWRKESDQNEILFQKICDKENLKERFTKPSVFNKEMGVKQILAKTAYLRRKHIFLNLVKYASLVLIPLLVGALLIMLNDKTPVTALSETKQTPIDILPGESKAVLTFENGEHIELLSDSKQIIEDRNGATISINENGLKYSADANTDSHIEETYNKLDIPRGGEYLLVLSDQSKVHLNSMSSLRFPVQFKNGKRIVDLEGEAYFDIAPDSKPFIVRIKGLDIEVYGTSFNISAYEGESAQTTLVSGSVRIVRENMTEGRVLQPSEQAVYDYTSKKMEVNKVDVSLYTSWVNGKIHFKDQRLEDILKSLARWYDMEVVYENEQAKDIRFGCNLNRYQDISPFIELLEKTGKVKIKTEGKNILIQ